MRTWESKCNHDWSTTIWSLLHKRACSSRWRLVKQHSNRLCRRSSTVHWNRCLQAPNPTPHVSFERPIRTCEVSSRLTMFVCGRGGHTRRGSRASCDLTPNVALYLKRPPPTRFASMVLIGWCWLPRNRENVTENRAGPRVLSKQLWKQRRRQLSISMLSPCRQLDGSSSPRTAALSSSTGAC